MAAAGGRAGNGEFYMSLVVEKNVERAVKVSCKHCGAPSPAGEFCCAGCAYVFRLVHDEGLDAYYRIKDDVTAPADTSLLQPRDYEWLQAAQRAAEGETPEGRATSLVLEVQGISCAGCVWLIE